VAYVEGGRHSRVAASRRRDAPWRRCCLSVVGEMPSFAEGVVRGNLARVLLFSMKEGSVV